MSELEKHCFTCYKTSSKFYLVGEYDSDKVSFWEKLQSCFADDLVTTACMELCFTCIKQLRISYQFRQTVMTTQAELRAENLKQETADTKPKLEQQSECESFAENDEKFACEYCDSFFEKPWQLRKHLGRVHLDIRKYICTYCNKDFKQANHLKEHITSHTGEKNYSCPICEKKFQRLSSQKRHLRSHDAPPGHKTKRTPFLCTICGKSFPYSNGVQRHMRIHLGIKKFECNLCKKKFTQSTHLHVHMRTHTGEKPYICDTCGEKFSLKACMLKHINSRHCSTSIEAKDEFTLYYVPDEFQQQ